MGGKKSKPAPPPPLLNNPWRKINWGRDKHEALEYVNTYRPHNEDLQLRILLHGPVGAGKSSFINSVTSVLRQRMCNRATVGNVYEDCLTKQYKTYKIEKENGFYPFVFNDMMGMKYSSRRTRKIHVKDVKQALKGHVRDGVTFNPERKLLKEDRYYNRAPGLNDRVHILVFIIDANTESLMKQEIVETIQDIRDEAIDLGIPQVSIFTKIDTVCPEIKQDVKNVYSSRRLQEKMEHFSAEVGIPLNGIFAVKNYHAETNLSDDTDTLILSVLRHIINYAGDFLSTREDQRPHRQQSSM
ncbi:interferon-induced protein 44-like isoform X1 [Mastacembelus armatus]|nr:interferon-induced protein 44-like isoform X1 [Mastacembelus armatus]XP_026163985.1 interferon-induced protein 44-like isoform X1 [Mastacembelus armatus]